MKLIVAILLSVALFLPINADAGMMGWGKDNNGWQTQSWDNDRKWNKKKRKAKKKKRMGKKKRVIKKKRIIKKKRMMMKKPWKKVPEPGTLGLLGLGVLGLAARKKLKK